MRSSHYSKHDQASDAALLDILTAPLPPTATKAFARRDAPLDPLLIAAAAASGPHVTRNHYHHDFFPGVMLPQSEGSWDWSKWTGEEGTRPGRKRLTYVSRQAPRRQRLPETALDSGKENDQPRETEPLKPAGNLPLLNKKRRSSLTYPPPNSDQRTLLDQSPNTEPLSSNKLSPLPLEVKCMARTRIPTPHGPAFLHLYHNNRDDKEHLAIVIDPAQLSGNRTPAPSIRSQSLDATWSENETEMQRITRGAYIGKLSNSSQHAFDPSKNLSSSESVDGLPPPLIRIHSECFTGETIGSMRCDCGEQLDEAIRLISQPITLSPETPISEATTIPGRGAVIYLRQEGRGIGLLAKIQAYNLQDLGHDTVTANIMLGHKADERGYEIAGAILRDLGLGSDKHECGIEGVRVLTNNPDKVDALEKEGVRVVERVPMIPRSWQHRHPPQGEGLVDAHVALPHQEKEEWKNFAGATLIGGKTVYGDDLDKYLRTKVLRMGHMLPLWMQEPEVSVYEDI